MDNMNAMRVKVFWYTKYVLHNAWYKSCILKEHEVDFLFINYIPLKAVCELCWANTQLGYAEQKKRERKDV